MRSKNLSLQKEEVMLAEEKANIFSAKHEWKEAATELMKLKIMDKQMIEENKKCQILVTSAE